MPQRVYNVLFLCTGNSARSLIAEAVLNHWGQGRFKAYSAGSVPKGAPHPLTLALLKDVGLAAEGLRSKSWDEFARPGAPELDFVFTVCDSAAAEACPVWFGVPLTAHWGVPDPAAAGGSEQERREAFRTALRQLESKVKAFTSLRVEEIDPPTLKRELENIGRSYAD